MWSLATTQVMMYVSSLRLILIDVKNGKPSPDIYLVGAKYLNLNPSECIVFEDSLSGCISGKKAGMTVIAVPDPKMDTTPFKEYADEILGSLLEFDPVKYSI